MLLIHEKLQTTYRIMQCLPMPGKTKVSQAPVGK